jgi:hypothetical protein
MKKFYLITNVLIILVFVFDGLTAQNGLPELNQVELMKQFSGKWECRISKDSTLTWDTKPYGTGFEVTVKGVVNGRVFLEARQLWGYDKQLDKYIVAVMHKGDDIRLYSAWFVSDKKYVSVRYDDISHPGTTDWRREGEFKSPYVYTESALVNNKQGRTHTNTRIN